MNRNRTSLLAAIAALFAMTASVAAQEPGPPPGGSASRGPGAAIEASATRLRVQVVISRYAGEKKIGSLPYSLVVVPGVVRTSIRLGVDTPVPASSGDGAGGTGLQYRNVGTNIDCHNVRELPGGRYQFDIFVQSTAVIPDEAGAQGPARPVFRRFDTNFTAQLRDGQSMQAIASTDPITGESVRIDVSLQVIRQD
jgi:hypothetical protein